ncbi:AAA family ATPase [Kitasatospora sp. NPDC088346]|uniref:helix-turn-helix transcriptional regulator n=1 Tax=Kitasatospora sp. NPDC088346 TaxID=3364073 RepID=UPI0038238E5E
MSSSPHEHSGTAQLPPAPWPIGREREGDALAALLAGHTAALITGEPGSGKSELLRSLTDRARWAGTTVLCAAADRLDAGFEFGVVRQLFEQLLADAPPGAPHPLLAGPAAAAAEVLGPRPPHSAGPAPADGAVLGGLHWLTVHLAARGPLLIAVDDLQWADPASLRWLSYLLRRAGGLPLGVLATIGAGATEPAQRELPGTVLQLFRQRVALGPLGAATVAAMAEQAHGQAPDEAFVRGCRHATNGNAFLLRALLRATAAAEPAPSADAAERLDALAPTEIGQAVRAALANAGPAAVEVAEAVAVLGGTPGTDQVAAVVGESEAVVEDALHALVETGVLRRVGPAVGFVHPVAARSLAELVLPSRRQRIHLAAARLLWAQNAPEDEVAARLLHTTGPLDEDWANEALRRSAAEALAAGDPDGAVAALRRALREPLPEGARATLLSMLGLAELASCVPTAVRNLRQSLELSHGAAARTSAARRLAMALFATDNYGEALDVLGRTSAELRGAGDEYALRLEIDYIYAGLSELATAAAVRPRLWELDLSDAGGGAVERPLAALLSLRAAMRGEDPAEAVEFAQRALTLGMIPADDESIVYNNAVFALGAAGAARTALNYADAAVAEARARGSVLGYAHAISTRANANCRLGRLAECRADAEAALESLREIGVGSHTSHCVFPVTTLLEARVRQGLLVEAEELLAQAGLTGELNLHWANDYVLLARGWLRLAQGLPEQALADFLLCGERSGTRGMAGPGFYPWRSEAALVLVSLGRHEEARVLAGEDLELARRWGVPEMIGVALRSLGAATPGRPGLALLREAVEVLGESDARLRRAQALVDLGAGLRAAGQVEEAREQLRQAVSLAHQCGATVIAEQAMDELRAAGDRPRTRTFQGVDALTPSERRVTALAVAGMTNKQIAQHLFVGLRTVEVHLTNAYGKLGIGGRPELSDALADATAV